MRRTESWPATRRPGDPATRRPGDPATRRPGDPATRRPGDPATRRPGDPATRRPGDPATRRPSDPATQRPSDPIVHQAQAADVKSCSAANADATQPVTVPLPLNVVIMTSLQRAPPSVSPGALRHLFIPPTFANPNKDAAALECAIRFGRVVLQAGDADEDFTRRHCRHPHERPSRRQRHHVVMQKYRARRTPGPSSARQPVPARRAAACRRHRGHERAVLLAPLSAPDMVDVRRIRLRRRPLPGLRPPSTARSLLPHQRGHRHRSLRRTLPLPARGQPALRRPRPRGPRRDHGRARRMIPRT